MIRTGTLRRLLGYSILLFVGFLLGTVVMGIASGHYRDLFAGMLVDRLADDQEVEANLAERAGNKVASLGHRWAAADLRSADAEPARWLDPGGTRRGLLSSLYVTLATWPYPNVAEVDPENRGARALAGLNRAKLAQTLEWAGYGREAEEQWQHAADLLGTTVEQLRRNENLVERGKELGIVGENAAR